MDWLIKFLARIVQWLHDFALWLPLQLYKLLCAGLVAVVQAIPVPSWMSAVSANLAAMPSGVAYFGSAFQLGAGLGIIISAYLLRFIIRRVPFIG